MTSENPFHMRRRKPHPCILMSTVLMLAIGACMVLWATISNYSWGNDTTILQEQKNGAVLSSPSHRRLAAKGTTLSPAAKAALMAANDRAKENAKEEGKRIHVDIPDELKIFRKYQKQSSNDGVEDQAFISGHELNKLKSTTRWEEFDPLRENTTLSEGRIESTPQVEYLGVMVDAARYYFEMDWLKRLIIYLHKLRFNLIHFRLTDDQNFMVRLSSYPQLKYSMTGDFYTPENLQELVSFAKMYDITIVPEVVMPLQAAAWAGIPGLIVQCPNYLCDAGREVPLNVHHDEFPVIIKGVLKEIIEIFDTPPMLHLGGTPTRHGEICLDEAGALNGMDWDLFEEILQRTLNEIGYPEDQIIRTETVYVNEDGEKELLFRVVGVDHYWFHVPEANTSDTQQEKPYILTTGVDFTMDNDDHALTIYTSALEALKLPRKPKAIIVGTLYLSPNFWLQRNVASRLIAISMGAGNAGIEIPVTQVANIYNRTCHSLLGPYNAKVCELQGRTAVEDATYLDAQTKQSNKWIRNICDRLTYSEKRRVFKPHMPDRRYTTKMGNDLFWHTLHKPAIPKSKTKAVMKKDIPTEVQKLEKRTVKEAGVILDLARSLEHPDRILQILETYIATLGLNLMQLRLVNDNVFAVKMDSQQQLANPPPGKGEDNIRRVSEFIPIVEKGSELGVDVFPEISITTNAGGWIKGGYLVRCPELYCKRGESIPNDIREAQFFSVAYSVLRELREVFSTSKYFHLGADERVDNLKCFLEHDLKDNEDPPYGTAEAKLRKIVMMLGIQPENIFRWDNGEQLSYEDRVGGITHYRVWEDPETLPDIRDGEPYFVTANILEGSMYELYKRTRDLIGLKPVGIMGEIRALDKEEWKLQHIGLRLLSFTMALSTEERLTEDNFKNRILDICRALTFPEYSGDPDCKSAEAALVIKEDDEENTDMPEIDNDAMRIRGEMCTLFTRERDSYFLKDAFITKIS